MTKIPIKPTSEGRGKSGGILLIIWSLEFIWNLVIGDWNLNLRYDFSEKFNQGWNKGSVVGGKEMI
jgi:hypothetical protein